MPVRPILRPLALVALVLAAACGDPAGIPDGLQGTYVLRTVGDAPLPVVYGEAGGGAMLSLVADTIHLDGRGRANRRMVVHRTAGTFGPDETMPFRQTLEYMRSGSTIEIGFFGPCNDTAACAPNEIGTVTPAGFELERWVVDRIAAARYERIIDVQAK